MRRKSLAPMYKSRPSKCFVLRDETITGTMLLMVYAEFLSWVFNSRGVRTHILDDFEAI